jgi:hypothetical protein
VKSEGVRAVRNSTKLTHMLLSTTLRSKIKVWFYRIVKKIILYNWFKGIEKTLWLRGWMFQQIRKIVSYIELLCFRMRTDSVPAELHASTWAVFRSPIWGAKSAQCVLNIHCSNSFVFSKNYLNFD